MTAGPRLRLRDRSTTKHLAAGRARRQKSPVKARLSNLIYPLRNAACWRCLGIDGYVVQEAAVLLLDFLQLKRLVSPRLGKRASFCLWACGLVKAECSVGYFEFLMRRVAVAVIPRPAAAIPASAIALGAVSPVFASLPAVVSACLPLLEFACLVELGGVFLPVADEPVGCRLGRLR